MNINTPLVIFKVRYHEKGSRGYDKYSSQTKDDFINYVEKGIAKGKKVKEDLDFLSYVDNPDKSYGAFNQYGLLTAKDKQSLRKKLRTTDSLIWDAIISLESIYGKEHLYSTDQAMKLINKVFPKFLERAGFDQKKITWYAGLHENTDNRHIHISWFQDEPTTYSRKYHKYIFHKGVIDRAVLSLMKVDVESFFLHHGDTFKNHRNKLLERFKADGNANMLDDYQKGVKCLIRELIEELPRSGSLKYHSGNMAPHREKLDQVVNLILLHPIYRGDYENMQQDLRKYDEEVFAIYQRNGQENKFKSVEKKFEKDMKLRMANMLIKQLVELRAEEYQKYEYIKNGKVRRKQELTATVDIVLKAMEENEKWIDEEYRLFEEYRYKMYIADLERRIENGEIERDEIEAEM